MALNKVDSFRLEGKEKGDTSRSRKGNTINLGFITEEIKTGF